MPIIIRSDVGRPLTHQELDGNFKYMRDNCIVSSDLKTALGTYITLVDFNQTITSLSSSVAQLELAQQSAKVPTVIPTPLIELSGKSNIISIQFADQGFDFTKNNPELFLFRYRSAKKKKVNGSISKKTPAKWVHPTTANATTKWAGWKFFNGKQTLYNPQTGKIENIPGRVTEFSIPNSLLPYQKFQINFNRYMFWRKTSVSGTIFDSNFIGESSPVNPTDAVDMYVGMGGNGVGLTGKFALAVAVNNPLATKENGLCPKIFGPLSETFYSVLAKVGGKDQPFTDIKLVTKAERILRGC